MLHTTNLTRMLDEVFSFPYQTRVLDDSFVYDSIKTQKDGTTTINVVVPGYSKEDLKLEVTDNILKLSSELDGKKFARQWKLSEHIDSKKIKADCKNGILTINLSNKDKTNKTLSININ